MPFQIKTLDFNFFSKMEEERRKLGGKISPS
jgi:hypothetical protein